MAAPQLSKCLRFEQLFYRDELSNDEIEFILEHLDSCSLGIHTSDAVRGTTNALLAAVDGNEPLPDDLDQDDERDAGLAGGIPIWQISLRDAVPLSLANTTVLSGDSEMVQPFELSTEPAAALKEYVPWVGKHILLIRSFNADRGKFIYQVEVDVDDSSAINETAALEIALVDTTGTHITAVVTPKMPSAILVGQLAEL